MSLALVFANALRLVWRAIQPIYGLLAAWLRAARGLVVNLALAGRWPDDCPLVDT
jgi:hypothetical protein